MKKLLLGIFALTTALSFAEGNYNTYLKFGVDVHSKFKYDDFGIGFNKKAKSAGLFIESTYDVAPNTELGLGIGYIARKGKKINTTELKGDSPKYNSIPLYLTGKYNFDINSSLKPYVKADLGYSFNHDKYTITYKNGDKETFKAIGGLYAGIGFGVEYNNFLADLSYVHTNGKYKTDNGTKEKIKNKAVRLSLGYKF